jgi:hypothetical protein
VSAQQICVSDAGQWTPEGSFRFEAPFAGYIEGVLKSFLTLVSGITNTQVVRTTETSAELHA